MSKEAVGYRQLEVWQTSMELVQAIYRLTSRLPEQERYGLIGQSQRASVSVPANLVEGYGRGEGVYARHIRIARGSLMELEVFIELFVKLKFIGRNDVLAAWQLSQKPGAMLTRLLQSIERRNKTPKPKKPNPQRRKPNAEE